MARESYVATRGTSTAVRKRCSSVAVKRIWAVLLLAPCSCSKHHSGVSGLAGADADAAWLATTGASSLARTFRALGLDATERGQAVLVAGKRVNVTARIDNKVKRDDRNFLAAEFGILVDGKRIPALTTGAIGVDDTPEHAKLAAMASTKSARSRRWIRNSERHARAGGRRALLMRPLLSGGTLGGLVVAEWLTDKWSTRR